MRILSTRKIKINKENLLSRIEENKQKHIKEYNEAVIAYKEEAKNQLEKQLEELSKGSLKVTLDLTHPVNSSEEYDKIAEVFKWEIDATIELTQEEFNQYVLDEMPFVQLAKLSNTKYLKL